MNLRFLLKDDSVISYLEQGFLPHTKEEKTKFVCLNNNELSLQEDEQNALSNALCYIKYSFRINNINYSIKNFYLLNLKILQVELIEQKTTYKMPEFLAKNCQDISDDESFSDLNLALFGAKTEISLQSVIEKVKKLQNFSLYTKEQISAYDGVKIVLLSLLQNLENAILDFKDKQIFEKLEIFEQILAIITAFKDIFDEKIIEKFIKEFLEFNLALTSLNLQHQLYEYLQKNEISQKNLVLKRKKIFENELLAKFKVLEPMIENYIFMLDEKENFYSSALGKNEIKSTLAPLINAKILDFYKTDSLQSSCKELYFLIFAFGNLFQASLARKLSKKLYKILKILGAKSKYEFLSQNLKEEDEKAKVAALIQKNELKIQKKCTTIAELLANFSAVLKIYYKG